MVKDPVSRRLDELIAGPPACLLRSRGFKRRSRNFHRPAGELAHSVWFQTARGGPGVFCVNLTVLFSVLHEVVHGEPLPASPSLLNSVPLASRRVAWTTEDGPQCWFVLRPATDPSELGDEVCERLAPELAWLDDWVGAEGALERYAAEPPSDRGPGDYHVQHAVLLAWRGRLDQALALLRGHGSRAGAPSAYAEIEQRLRARFGGGRNGSVPWPGAERRR